MSPEGPVSEVSGSSRIVREAYRVAGRSLREKSRHMIVGELVSHNGKS